MNVWNFTGNLGRAAESRYTAGGDAVTNFSVAVKSGFGNKEATTWVNCSMWGDRGTKVAPYLTKGQLVGVSGEACLRKYEKDGVEKMSMDLRVNDVTLLGKKEDQPQAAPQQEGFRSTDRPAQNEAPF